MRNNTRPWETAHPASRELIALSKRSGAILSPHERYARSIERNHPDIDMDFLIGELRRAEAKLMGAADCAEGGGPLAN